MRPVESVTRYGLEPATNDFPRAGEMREWERKLPPIFPSPPELTRVENAMIGYQVPDMNQSAAIGKVKLKLLFLLWVKRVFTDGYNNSSYQSKRIQIQDTMC